MKRLLKGLFVGLVILTFIVQQYQIDGLKREASALRTSIRLIIHHTGIPE